MNLTWLIKLTLVNQMTRQIECVIWYVMLRHVMLGLAVLG
jgi:hypothetical protein